MQLNAVFQKFNNCSLYYIFILCIQLPNPRQTGKKDPACQPGQIITSLGHRLHGAFIRISFWMENYLRCGPSVFAAVPYHGPC